MTSVARPPRRPSTLAIRSLWPAHVPTRDTVSALSTGVETRMAKVVAYRKAFMSSLHASILESRTSDVSKMLLPQNRHLEDGGAPAQAADRPGGGHGGTGVRSYPPFHRSK